MTASPRGGRPARALISASRRTDVPQYFARWFAARRRAGHAEYRTAFGVRGRVSLADADVLGYVFWTKYAASFAEPLRALRGDGVPYAFQYTVTGYGAPLEQHIPRLATVISDFLRVADGLPGPHAIEWRYDPIVLSPDRDPDWHRRRFAEIAAALAGSTRVVNTSIVEPYAKTQRRVGEVAPGVRYRPSDPARQRQPRRGRALLMVGAEARELLQDLSAIAASHQIELRACCNPEWGLPPSQCCGAGLFADHEPEIASRISAMKPGPSRPTCCCVRTVDIGTADTCLGGCRYCYVVRSQQLALSNFRRHDPEASALQP